MGNPLRIRRRKYNVALTGELGIHPDDVTVSDVVDPIKNRLQIYIYW